MSHASPRRLSPAALRAALAEGGELAILDVREEGVSAKRRLFYSSVAPLGRLGVSIAKLVPRRSTPIVLVDECGEFTAQAAARLERFGYTNVSILDGGVGAWERAGHEVFSGTNVPGKSFGEVIEHRLHTPNIDAVTLNRLQASGADLVVLDSRPFGEYRTMNIPGGVECAGAELVYRALAEAPSPETLIVVNCAGRTRSILGAQSLINAGVPNPVAALTGGSMSWLLEDFALEYGQIRTAARPDEITLDAARRLAERAAAKAGVKTLDALGLARLETGSSQRTVYRFDVRDPLEYEAAHHVGWRSAPGGQLVQATDEYVGTLHAIVVLRDDDGVRARMTASWLMQLGYLDVYVYEANGEDDADPRETGAEPRIVFPPAAPTRWMHADHVFHLMKEGQAQVVDVDASLAFRRAHVPDATFVAASRLEDFLDAVSDPAKQLVLTSADGVLAADVADQIRERRPTVAALLGGTQRWQALNLPVATGDAGNLTGDEDAWYSPYHAAPENVAEQMRAYLAWELQLVDQVERDGVAVIDIIDFKTDTAANSRQKIAALGQRLATAGIAAL